MMDKIRINGVAKAIEEAFATVPYPGDDNIAYGQDYDPSDGWECAQVFKGTHWREVQPRLLLRCSSTVSFTPEAFRYYLPAYMLGRLLHSDEVDVAGEFVVYGLNPPEDERERAAWLAKIEPLTATQKAAVRMFLEAVAIDPDDLIHAAQKALDAYWGRF